jgi:phenylpropionate dioxygenase-like ring-hydroxylating dioxygenase large terminal subunit
MERKDLGDDEIRAVTVSGTPLVVYPKNESALVIHSDVCPHMGASFSRGGWLSPETHLVCPYHGFQFDEGRFMSLSSPSVYPKAKKPSSHCVLPTYSSMTLHDYVYLFPVVSPNAKAEYAEKPYFPPEHDDPEFVCIRGKRVIDCPVESLVENLLDMLHISYVHSFGNIELPLPVNVLYQETGELSGRTTFEYEPNSATISRLVGKNRRVIVENEFYLPTTTLTRVRAGKVVKTVFTQSVPISETQCILFWSVYRNFWRDPYIPEFTLIGDLIMGNLMEKTIDEDVSILSRTYPEKRYGFLTKYDVTIGRYREARKRFSKANPLYNGRP